LRCGRTAFQADQCPYFIMSLSAGAGTGWPRTRKANTACPDREPPVGIARGCSVRFGPVQTASIAGPEQPSPRYSPGRTQGCETRTPEPRGSGIVGVNESGTRPCKLILYEPVGDLLRRPRAALDSYFPALSARRTAQGAILRQTASKTTSFPAVHPEALPVRRRRTSPPILAVYALL